MIQTSDEKKCVFLYFIGFMRTGSVIMVMVSLLLLEGCDFLRSMAGRPTSEEMLAWQSSVREVPAAAVDSVALADSLLTELSGQVSPAAGYLVIACCFRYAENAEKAASWYRGLGYETCIVSRDGLQLVGLCPTGDIYEAYSTMVYLKRIGVCPKGSWVLENR